MKTLLTVLLLCVIGSTARSAMAADTYALIGDPKANPATWYQAKVSGSPTAPLPVKKDFRQLGDACATCATTPNESTGASVVLFYNGRAYPLEPVTSLLVNKGDSIYSDVDCALGGLKLSAGKVALLAAGGTLLCGLGEKQLSVTVQDLTKNDSQSPPPRACTTADFAPPAPLPTECSRADKNSATLCVDLSGVPVGVPPKLEAGMTLTVEVIASNDTVLSARGLVIAVQYERAFFLPPIVKTEMKQVGVQSIVLARQQVAVKGAGQLTIKIDRSGAGTIAGSTNCTLTGTDTNTINVEGDYYASLGIAPIYSWRRGRQVGVQPGLDGVRRILDDPTDNVDVMLNIVFYPWGVRDTTPAHLGLFIGTSLSEPGKSWGFGPQLSFPVVGMGLVAGVTANIVDKTDRGFVSGLAWNRVDDNLPTHTAAQIGAFAGINIQDDLFKKVFKLGSN